MNRLTQKDEQGNWHLEGIRWENFWPGKVITEKLYEALYDALRKLAEYEDTGLSPEDVERVNDFELTSTARLMAKLKEEQQKHRWIPAEESLPEPGAIVLVNQIYSWEHFEEGAMVTIGRLCPKEPGIKPYWEFQHYRPDFRHGTIMDNGIICPGNEYVTAWMPLPEPYQTRR